MRLPNSHPTWRLDEQGNWQRTDYVRPPIVVPPGTLAGTERAHADWRKRLNRNLSRSSDSRWDPLTYHVDAPTARVDGATEDGPGPTGGDDR